MELVTNVVEGAQAERLLFLLRPTEVFGLSLWLVQRSVAPALRCLQSGLAMSFDIT